MSEFLKKLWHRTKTRGEDIGLWFLKIGSLIIIVRFVLVLAGVPTETTLFALGLALISVGLGFTSVGMSAKSDRRQTELLETLDKNVAGLPLLFKGDILGPLGQRAVEELQGQSKEAAQRRLDGDTQKVGYVRGELFQTDDGSWAIHWGW